MFVYGKKQSRVVYFVAGLAFMAYPYFTPSLTALVGVGVALGAALWLAVRGGW